eukprot:COSAG04_NODE_8772_length_932_cov_1.912365_2_plen_169_part_01
MDGETSHLQDPSLHGSPARTGAAPRGLRGRCRHGHAPTAHKIFLALGRILAGNFRLAVFENALVTLHYMFQRLEIWRSCSRAASRSSKGVGVRASLSPRIAESQQKLASTADSCTEVVEGGQVCRGRGGPAEASPPGGGAPGGGRVSSSRSLCQKISIQRYRSIDVVQE